MGAKVSRNNQYGRSPKNRSQAAQCPQRPQTWYQEAPHQRRRLRLATQDPKAWKNQRWRIRDHLRALHQHFQKEEASRQENHFRFVDIPLHLFLPRTRHQINSSRKVQFLQSLGRRLPHETRRQCQLFLYSPRRQDVCLNRWIDQEETFSSWWRFRWIGSPLQCSKICLDQGRISVLSLVHRSEDFQNSSIVDYLFLLQWKQKFHRQIRLPQWAVQRPTPISGRHCHESILLKIYPYLQRRRTCLLILHSQIGQNQKTQRRCYNWIHRKRRSLRARSCFEGRNHQKGDFNYRIELTYSCN